MGKSEPTARKVKGESTSAVVLEVVVGSQFTIRVISGFDLYKDRRLWRDRELGGLPTRCWWNGLPARAGREKRRVDRR